MSYRRLRLAARDESGIIWNPFYSCSTRKTQSTPTSLLKTLDFGMWLCGSTPQSHLSSLLDSSLQHKCPVGLIHVRCYFRRDSTRTISISNLTKKERNTGALLLRQQARSTAWRKCKQTTISTGKYSMMDLPRHLGRGL